MLILSCTQGSTSIRLQNVLPTTDFANSSMYQKAFDRFISQKANAPILHRSYLFIILSCFCGIVQRGTAVRSVCYPDDIKFHGLISLWRNTI